jgi:hypothetical protein
MICRSAAAGLAEVKAKLVCRRSEQSVPSPLPRTGDPWAEVLPEQILDL